MNLRKLGALAFGAMLVAAACNTGGGTATGTPAATAAATATTVPSKGTVTIAVELPFQGSEKAASDPILKGIRLAVKKAGGVVGGYTVVIPDSAVYDDSVNGKHDPQTGAKNTGTIVSDPNVIAMIGPLNSSVAFVQIPISNEAGLLQCSPANTNQGLTKPADGALDVRKAHPTDINYVRVVTTDDKQGPAMAKYAITKLNLKKIYIIDDTEIFGKGIADTFEKEFKAEGGEVVQHDGAGATVTDFGPLMTAAAALHPDSIYFGGVTSSGGARILKAAVQAGLGDIPYLGSDGINDGSAASDKSFLNLAGDDAKNAHATLAAIGDFPGKATFDAAYKAEYNEDPGSYSGTGYACAQVVLKALETASATNPTDMAGLREAVRKAAVDPTVTYDSVLGAFHFDENGDTSQLIISIYDYDSATKDWVYKEQIDYGQ
jgi:branched-chain amino acid transport system substrate-binding protein